MCRGGLPRAVNTKLSLTKKVIIEKERHWDSTPQDSHVDTNFSPPEVTAFGSIPLSLDRVDSTVPPVLSPPDVPPEQGKASRASQHIITEIDTAVLSTTPTANVE